MIVEHTSIRLHIELSARAFSEVLFLVKNESLKHTKKSNLLREQKEFSEGIRFCRILRSLFF